MIMTTILVSLTIITTRRMNRRRRRGQIMAIITIMINGCSVMTVMIDGSHGGRHQVIGADAALSAFRLLFILLDSATVSSHDFLLRLLLSLSLL